MTDLPLTWHDGATVEGIPAPARRAPKPRAGAGESLADEAHAIPALVAQKAASGDLDTFKVRILTLRSQDTPTLIARILTTDDALTLWALHLEVDKRNVAPALRWPPNTNSPQTEFIAFAADLFWFTKRNPHHIPSFRGWMQTLKQPPASQPWHAAVHRQFLFAAQRNSLAHLCAKGLALTEGQRLELLTLPTGAMQAERRQLQPERFAELRAQLLTHAMANPDKSGMHRPHDVANRRAAIWRTYLLSGRCKATTTRNWQLLSGRPVTRQALTKQIAIVEDVARSKP